MTLKARPVTNPQIFDPPSPPSALGALGPQPRSALKFEHPLASRASASLRKPSPIRWPSGNEVTLQIERTPNRRTPSPQPHLPLYRRSNLNSR